MEKNELLPRIKLLQKKFVSIEDKLDLEKKEKQRKILAEKMNAGDFWNDQESAQKISQEAAHLEDFIKRWKNFSTEIHDFPELLDMSGAEDIPALEKDLSNLESLFVAGESELLLNGEYDSNNAIITINTGTGGQDAEDFSNMLLRMYLRFAEQKKFRVKMLEESQSDVGLKSAMFSIEGVNAYGFLKGEHGVHRLIRLSPFNAKNLRQTSFSRIDVIPEIEQDTDVEIEEKDLRIDVFRASGNGGQSVNTTDSAVRITYLPLNLVVTCQNEKSQLQNKAAAMKVLKSRLLQLKLEQNAEKISELKGNLAENSFGSQIRSYTLQPYKLVKDHRTNQEHSNPEKVLDGALDGFIQAYLRRVDC